MRWCLLVCLLAIVGCGTPPPPAPEPAAEVSLVGDWYSGGPVTDDEQRVAEYIKEFWGRSGTNVTVEFIQFGPHDNGPGPPKTHWQTTPRRDLFRVQFYVESDDRPPMTLSRLFAVEDGKVSDPEPLNSNVPMDWMRPRIEQKARERPEGKP